MIRWALRMVWAAANSKFDLSACKDTNNILIIQILSLCKPCKCQIFVCFPIIAYLCTRSDGGVGRWAFLPDERIGLCHFERLEATALPLHLADGGFRRHPRLSWAPGRLKIRSGKYWVESFSVLELFDVPLRIVILLLILQALWYGFSLLFPFFPERSILAIRSAIFPLLWVV